MKEEYICGTCGKKLKNGAGLAGHKMLAHPIVKEQVKTNPPDEALAEISDDVKRSMERLEDSESHVQELQEQLLTANGRFDDFRESILERLQKEEEAKQKAESAAQAALRELNMWRDGQLHQPLRLHWDQAENCEDCARDKAAIVAELAAQSNAEALEAAREADDSASEQASQRSADAGPEDSEGSLLDTNGEAGTIGTGSTSEQAARAKRFRVVGETFLASLLFEGYQRLPDEVEEPREGDETEDEVLAEHWRKAGYGVEEIEYPGDDAVEPDSNELSGWLARIYGEQE